jgi:hypothetical protein
MTLRGTAGKLHSDLILHAYRVWDTRCVHHPFGDFAFAAHMLVVATRIALLIILGVAELQPSTLIYANNGSYGGYLLSGA